MALDPAEVGWFINNVGLAAASFGVSSADISTVAGVLMQYFGYRCSPPLAITDGADLQSICVNAKCPKDPMAVCQEYPWNGVSPEPKSVCGGYGSGGD